MKALYLYYQQTLRQLSLAQGIAPLMLRLYLAPIFMQAGWQKFQHFEQTALWFSQDLGMPMPELMVVLAAGSELVGGTLLIIGLAVRFFSIPLMITMVIAAITVHWGNGWLAIADSQSWLANERVLASAEQLEMGRSILKEYGHYPWLTKNGPFVILNNGIEFAATYFIMLLSLLFTGAGRFTSADYWVKQMLHRRYG